ncbi:MAG: VWA domain-containing protein [Chloroflexi bacterium]|nr:VWA domain-containing protein [Chloroflexota bacterium]
MSFSTPLALVLLLTVPFVLYIGWPRQRFRRVRDSVSLALRTLIVLLLVFSLAGIQVVQSADRLAVVFLLDVSDSMGAEAQNAALEYIRAALATLPPDDEVGVVLFGANALVERPLAAVRELAPVRSTPITGNTDIAEAIRLGLALFPADAARRIVLLSDGHATVGDTQAAAQLAAAAGVEISYVNFSRQPGPEVQVTNVVVPDTVNEGQQFDLSVTIEAQAATAATVTILGAGEIIHQEVVNLRAGTNNYSLRLQSGGTGFRDFVVQVDPVGNDAFFQNNQMATFSRVVGPPRVLVVSVDDAETQYLIPALEQSGLVVDTATPNSLPVGIGALAQYDSVILVNVPATQLSNRRMQLIESYVKDLGGGLVVIGGPQAYGPGGYFQTPLEDALPVEMQIRDQQRLPQLTIAYVIDRSGSMSAIGPSGVENIELAKEAIIRSIELLQPIDRAGVASFDSLAAWIAPFQNVDDRVQLQRLVGTLRASGGTDILAGMSLVAREIVNEPSQFRHIIMLTDGGADPSGLVELSDALYQEDGVTTSVIAIGMGIPTFLQEMATAGGGNFHAVETVEAIPTIFAQETVLAQRSYIIETPFFPVQVNRSPILNGITSVPELLGYVATSPRDTAQVILRTPDENADPLLAAWQYGLGRSVAFTSDATARWGQNWVDWSDYALFWSQAVRWTITEGATGNLETRVVMENEQARIIVDARDDQGAFLNGLTLQASVVSPDGSSESALVMLQQVAPGRYEAVFTPGSEGAYFMLINGVGVLNGQDITVNQRAGWVLNYSAEYDVATNARDGQLLLGDIATLTGGRSLADDPAAVFRHDLRVASGATPLWPWLLLLALLLLPLDIAVRRLVVTQSDLRRLRAWAFPARAAGAAGERFNPLMSAKARAQQRVEEQAEGVRTTPPAANPRATLGTLLSRKEKDAASAAPPTTSPAPSSGRTPPSPVPPKTAPHPLEKPPAPSSTAGQPRGNVAGKLLERRKRDSAKPD